ncbi:MAG: hypothetical protein V1726_05750 [Methanobacteriota archaeon]
MKMYVAKAKGHYIEVPPGAWYSFYNSPYISHKLGTAIDVYYPDRPLFPFEEGIVKEVKKIRTPKNIAMEIDFLTIIEVNNLCLKILHVKPDVRAGEKVYQGDEFGDLILSGFFMPWSDKHAHFELRDCRDRYRSRGGFPIEPIIVKAVPSISGNEFKVVEKRDTYFWLRPMNVGERNLTPLTYKSVSIEGGLPYYKYGAIFGKEKEVILFGRSLQNRKYLHHQIGIFETNFEVIANDQKVKGIGIYCNQEKIKLIGGIFQEGDIIEIKINK